MNGKVGLLVFASLCLLLLPAMLGVGFIMPVESKPAVTNVQDANLQTTADDWPMFMHDLMHTGYSASKAPNTNKTLWNYTTGSYVTSDLAVADGVVFIGSYDKKLYALNVSTGELVWSYTTGGSIYSCPAVAYGKVFVGSLDNNVYALNASTGTKIWNYMTGDDILYSSPAVVDGVVYIGSCDGNVYALNVTTGAKIWNYTTGCDGVCSSPAVAYGIIFIAAADTWYPGEPPAIGMVYALNASTGAKIWNYTTYDQILVSSPAVADGVVFIGSNDNNVYALNASTGTKIWSYMTDYLVQSTPAVAYGMVFIGACDHKVYALNVTTGAKIWSYKTDDIVVSSPAVAYGKVFIGSIDNNTYALNASTGELVWSYTTGYGVFSSPAVAYGKVFIGSGDYKVYCFGEDTTPPIADAGNNQTVNEDTLVTFNGSDSWDNMGITNYTWTFTDITPKTLTGVISNYTFATPGTYIVTLNVSDAAGNWNTDTVEITILDTTPPVANAGQNQTVAEDTDVTFNASLSTDNAGIANYTWNFGDGNTTTVTDPIVYHTYKSPGTYTVTLTVKDAAGNTATDTITVTVEAAPTTFPWAVVIVGLTATIAILAVVVYLVKAKKPGMK